VIATLEGRPGGPLGRVRLALIRTEGEGEKSNWLLHRMKTDIDGRVQPDGAPVEPSAQADDRRMPRRDRPGRSAAPARRASPAEPPAAVPLAWPPDAEALRPMLSTSATPERATLAARQWGERAWAEAKWDGIRAVGVWDGSRLRLVARSGNDITFKYPEVTDADAGLGEEPAIVDGEIVAIDESGRPSFPLLQTRMNLQRAGDIAREAKRTPVQYYLFDVLGAHGADVASRPLRERRKILEELTSAAIAAIVVPPVFDDVDEALRTSRQFDLEGVVVKDPASTYRRGQRSESWLKVKLTRTQEVVLAGIRPGRGGRSHTFGSLLLGIPGPDGLHYAGRVGTGFSDSTLRSLMRTLAPLHSAENPLVGVPAADTRDVQWLRPELVGEVEFGEFTPGGILRHSRWRGLRPDKPAADVVRES
jgi:bifunctional non-homologous end joining protein LigD